MGSEILYRQGEVKDSYRIAQLIDQSSPGVIDYLYRDLLHKVTPLQFCAQILCVDPVYNVRNVIVADRRSRVVGAVMSFPSSKYTMNGKMQSILPAEKLKFMRHFSVPPDTNAFLLDAICVHPDYRGQGIGKYLMRRAVEQALQGKYACIRLIVRHDNQFALRWYDQLGFKVVKEVGPLAGNGFIDGLRAYVLQLDLA